MLDLQFFREVVEEVPAVGRAHAIKVGQFYLVFFGLIIIHVFLRLFFFKQLRISDASVRVLLNECLNFVRFHVTEAFEKDGVFDVLDDMRIDSFKCISGLKPLVLPLLTEIPLPHPVSTIQVPEPLLLLELFLLLGK